MCRLLKTRSEIYSFSDWIWNLTWFSVTLIEDNKNVTVMTDITGLSVYTYSQSYAVAMYQEMLYHLIVRGKLRQL